MKNLYCRSILSGSHPSTVMSQYAGMSIIFANNIKFWISAYLYCHHGTKVHCEVTEKELCSQSTRLSEKQSLNDTLERKGKRPKEK